MTRIFPFVLAALAALSAAEQTTPRLPQTPPAPRPRYSIRTEQEGKGYCLEVRAPDGGFLFSVDSGPLPFRP